MEPALNVSEIALKRRTLRVMELTFEIEAKRVEVPLQDFGDVGNDIPEARGERGGVALVFDGNAPFLKVDAHLIANTDDFDSLASVRLAELSPPDFRNDGCEDIPTHRRD